MSSLRTIYTCDYKTCEIACNEWTPQEITILRYSPTDQHCVCFHYPYAQLYYYLDNPVGEGVSKDTEEFFAVRSQSFSPQTSLF